MLLAAYSSSDLSPLQLRDAFRVTANESRREDFKRIAGRENLNADLTMVKCHKMAIVRFAVLTESFDGEVGEGDTVGWNILGSIFGL